MAESFDDGHRLGLPALPLKMDISILEIQEARRVVFKTVPQGPLQELAIDLLFGEEALGFQTLVPRVSREPLEVPLDEPLPRLELEEPVDCQLELLDGPLVLSPAGPPGDELPGDERELVGDDLLAAIDIEHEEFVPRRVDLDLLVFILSRQLIAAGLDRNQGFFIGRSLFPAAKHVFPENRVP